jgi:hypothetical protein
MRKIRKRFGSLKNFIVSRAVSSSSITGSEIDLAAPTRTFLISLVSEMPHESSRCRHHDDT